MNTPYTIEKSETNNKVLRDGKIVAQGFMDVESSLHSMWVINGKDLNTFYTEKDGIVSKKVNDE